MRLLDCVYYESPEFYLLAVRMYVLLARVMSWTFALCFRHFSLIISVYPELFIFAASIYKYHCVIMSIIVLLVENTMNT